jgi:ribosomal protein S18 acetylase RimI-like enzyme
MGRWVYNAIADEDLESVLVKGMTVLGGGREHPWGVLMVDPETRPVSLPAHAPKRAQLRVLALRQGPYVAEAGPALMAGLERAAGGHETPLLVHVLAGEPWMQRVLNVSGYTLADTVVYFRLEPLTVLSSESGKTERVVLESASPALSAELAELDAETFDPLWHFDSSDMAEMSLRGRMRVARVERQAAGYAALLPGGQGDAHLARLAVHPDFQGRGVGRRLLEDAIAFAREEGYRAMTLNTQASNDRSQSLYRAMGFRESGVSLPVYTRVLFEGSGAD